MICLSSACLLGFGAEMKDPNTPAESRWELGSRLCSHSALILLALLTTAAHTLLPKTHTYSLTPQKKPKAPINIPNTAPPLNRVHKSQDRNGGLTPAALFNKCQVRRSLFALHNCVIMQALVSIITTEQPLIYIQKSVRKWFVFDCARACVSQTEAVWRYDVLEGRRSLSAQNRWS